MKLYRINWTVNKTEFYIEANDPFHAEQKIEELFGGIINYHLEEALQNTAHLHYEIPKSNPEMVE